MKPFYSHNVTTMLLIHSEIRTHLNNSTAILYTVEPLYSVHHWDCSKRPD